MASAVEVICDVDGVAAAKVAFKAEIGLLRIGIDKVLRLRISERLESEGQVGELRSNSSGSGIADCGKFKAWNCC